MCLHPRLGKGSPARTLNTALVRVVFSYLCDRYKRALLLITSFPTSPIISRQQDQLRVILRSKLRSVDSISEVDGGSADETARELRDRLFAMSGLRRGIYPLVFLETEGGHHYFVGTFDTIQRLNECGDLPPELLASHPGIVTLHEITQRIACRAAGGGSGSGSGR
jgi:hypothetical protein